MSELETKIEDLQNDAVDSMTNAEADVKKAEEEMNEEERLAKEMAAFNDPDGLLTNFIFNHNGRGGQASFIGSLTSRFRERNVRSQFTSLKEQAESILKSDYDFKMKAFHINRVTDASKNLELLKKAKADDKSINDAQVNMQNAERALLASQGINPDNREAVKSLLNEVDAVPAANLTFGGEDHTYKFPAVELENELIKLKKAGTFELNGEKVNYSKLSISQILDHQKSVKEPTGTTEKIQKLHNHISSSNYNVDEVTKRHNDEFISRAQRYREDVNAYVEKSDKNNVDFSQGLGKMNAVMANQLESNNLDNVKEREKTSEMSKNIKEMIDNLLASLGLKR